jgi:hypothetical protein
MKLREMVPAAILWVSFWLVVGELSYVRSVATSRAAEIAYLRSTQPMENTKTVISERATDPGIYNVGICVDQMEGHKSNCSETIQFEVF